MVCPYLQMLRHSTGTLGRRNSQSGPPAPVVRDNIDHGEGGVSAGVVRVQPDRLLEIRDRLGVVVGRGPPIMLPALYKRIVARRYARLFPAKCDVFCIGELDLQCVGNAPRHLVLKREDIGERTVELAGPHMAAAERVDELRIYPQMIAGSLNTAFEHIADPEFL